MEFRLPHISRVSMLCNEKIHRKNRIGHQDVLSPEANGAASFFTVWCHRIEHGRTALRIGFNDGTRVFHFLFFSRQEWKSQPTTPPRTLSLYRLMVREPTFTNHWNTFEQISVNIPSRVVSLWQTNEFFGFWDSLLWTPGEFCIGKGQLNCR